LRAPFSVLHRPANLSHGYESWHSLSWFMTSMQAVSASREEGGGGGGRGQRRRHGRERVEDAPVCWWSANGGCILPGSPAAVDEAVRAKERLAFGDPPRPSLRRPPFAPVQGCTARAPPPTVGRPLSVSPPRLRAGRVRRPHDTASLFLRRDLGGNPSRDICGRRSGSSSSSGSGCRRAGDDDEGRSDVAGFTSMARDWTASRRSSSA